jgi:hypothetical protein
VGAAIAGLLFRMGVLAADEPATASTTKANLVGA